MESVAREEVLSFMKLCKNEGVRCPSDAAVPGDPVSFTENHRVRSENYILSRNQK